MVLVSLCRRALMKLVRWDGRDRLKWLIVRLARPLAAPPAPISINDIERVFQYTFPEKGDSGVVVRCPLAPEVVGERSMQTATDFNWTIDSALAADARCSRLLVLWGPESGDALISRFAETTSDYLILSVPSYPENLFCNSLPAPFERISWWDSQAAACGLSPVGPPRERFQGLYPRCYRKATEPESKPTFAENSRIVFATPDRAGAFRWVAEDLAQALNAEGLSAGFQCHDGAERVLTWAHYWPDYDVEADRRDAELFVTNFRFKPQGRLTPWLEALVERKCLKVAASQFSADALGDLGVPSEQVHVISHGYSPEFSTDAKPLNLATEKSFRLLAVVNSHDPQRYGLDLLLAAASRAFSAADDFCLVIKDYGADCDRFKIAIAAWGGQGPEVLYYANFMSKGDLARFYRGCSAFVAPFRGEGFGMKILDAAVIGLPLILPLYGGPTDYCEPDFVWPVKFDEVEVGDCLETRELHWNEKLTWCEPRVEDLARQMRAVYEQQTEAKRRAMLLRERVIRDFSWARAAQKFREALDL